MRQIKFRAWDTKRNKMWSAEEMGKDGLTLSPDGRGFVNISGESTKLNQYCTHLIPLQFTGLKDKDDVEIYAGDKIKRDCVDGRTSTVEWEGIGWNPFVDDLCESHDSIYYEIIGNKWDDKKLLE